MHGIRRAPPGAVGRARVALTRIDSRAEAAPAAVRSGRAHHVAVAFVPLIPQCEGGAVPGREVPGRSAPGRSAPGRAVPGPERAGRRGAERHRSRVTAGLCSGRRPAWHGGPHRALAIGVAAAPPPAATGQQLSGHDEQGGDQGGERRASERSACRPSPTLRRHVRTAATDRASVQLVGSAALPRRAPAVSRRASAVARRGAAVPRRVPAVTAARGSGRPDDDVPRRPHHDERCAGTLRDFSVAVQVMWQHWSLRHAAHWRAC
jgi:hypothetical protein